MGSSFVCAHGANKSYICDVLPITLMNFGFVVELDGVGVFLPPGQGS